MPGVIKRPCARMKELPPEALEEVAGFFQALAEPTRLQILNLLRGAERNVGEIAQITGFSPANVSRHLALLAERGLVQRESRGTSAWYRIADPQVYQLCDLVCGSIARHESRRARERQVFVSAAAPVKGRRRLT